jgi:hypothetical protein
MRFLVVERVRGSAIPSDQSEFAKVAGDDLRYKLQLEKKGKIVAGGPFLDTLADGYILETKTLEELGEILFNSPTNLGVDREVHPLGTFEDSLEGMDELRKKRK